MQSTGALNSSSITKPWCAHQKTLSKRPAFDGERVAPAKYDMSVDRANFESVQS